MAGVCFVVEPFCGAGEGVRVGVGIGVDAGVGVETRVLIGTGVTEATALTLPSFNASTIWA